MDATRRDFMANVAAVTGGVLGSSVGAPAPAAAQTPSGGGARPLSKRAQLRALLQKPGPTLVPEAHCVFAARLAELNGFEAIYVGGNMLAAMYLGLEDWGLISMTELVDLGGRIASGVSIPAIVDADQGGENTLNVFRSIQEYERAGIAGFHIEDTRNPKHRGQGKSELMPLDEMVARITAAAAARTDPEFVIIARSDCMALGPNAGDPNEAIRRGRAFAEAGADALFLPGMRATFAGQIARAVPLPLLTLNIALPDLQDTGVKIGIHAVQIYQPAMKLYETMVLELKEHGRFLRTDDRRLSPETAAKVMRTADYDRLAEEWNRLRG